MLQRALSGSGGASNCDYGNFTVGAGASTYTTVPLSFTPDQVFYYWKSSSTDYMIAALDTINGIDRYVGKNAYGLYEGQASQSTNTVIAIGTNSITLLNATGTIYWVAIKQ